MIPATELTLEQVTEACKKPITYEKIIRDIVSVSAKGDDVQTRLMVTGYCNLFTGFLQGYTNLTNDGYFLMSALLVCFTEMRRVMAEAKGSDKVLIEGMVQAIVGSFGKTIN